MNSFDLFKIDKWMSGGIVDTIEVFDYIDAVKSYLRNHSKEAFYYKNWNNGLSCYVMRDNENILIPVLSYLSTDTKADQLNRIYLQHPFFVKTYKPKICDCGSEKVFGKNQSAHSHWCSLNG
jgi:hypothetical protein